VQGYIGAAPEAMRFFPRHYRSLADLRAKTEEVDGRFDAEARKAALEALSTGPEEARAAAWLAGEGLMVTTGQQPGLFGGPLYSLYKALGAIRLAEALEEALDRPVLPVFWVADEDHDWAEANHTYLLDLENEPHRIEVDDPGHTDRALHRVPLDGAAQSALARFVELLPETDFSDPYLKSIQDGYGEDATLADGFYTLMRDLLAPRGLCFAHASQARLKELSRPVLFDELVGGSEHEGALADRAAELEEAGFGTQVTVMEGGVNLFMEGPQGRERVYRDDDAFRLNTSGEVLTLEEIEEQFAADPRCLSPNVLLRPVVESRVFPTVSYVAGPGETAYFAQLSPLFDAHGIEMPLITPRPSFTVIEAKIAKVLDKFSLGVDDLARPFHEIASEIARDEVPDDVQRTLGMLRGAIGKGIGEVMDAAKEVDPTLKGPVNHVRNQAFYEIDELQKKIVQSVKRQSEIALAQLEKAQKNLYPEGKPQERVLNPHYYLFRYGNSFVDALVEKIDVAFVENTADLRN